MQRRAFYQPFKRRVNIKLGAFKPDFKAFTF